ncbi:bifunctional DNA-formamidopyrimidine glycosylase/DNA-(apurinic or apyrimidinic site) lyase [Candidatus Daviesbacteria bacterium]|nr:bifunctional DNA-formamidopyrimidine glycosylase/DNA-(apurinic or apyrimidinic site) lyase [Candidatus Daviesbacteria bacterium]
MPELPEVEVIRLGLQNKIIGLKIQKIQILSPKSFIGNPNLAQGQKVLKVWRRAKLLGIDLAEGTGYSGQGTVKKVSKLKPVTSNLITLLFHMKMSGQLIWEGGRQQATGDNKFIGGHPTEDMLGKMPNSHTRVIFTLQSLESSGKSLGKKYEKSRLSTLATSHLYFNDQRKFGWVKVVDRQQVTVDSSIKNLGPEPLEKGFTWQVLKQNLLKHKKMPVKVAIMDQSVVSGVGNIYSNEACFMAGIDPRTKVVTLTDRKFQALHRGVVRALREGIKHGGSTRAHFVDAEGHKGYFLDYAFVYWRDKHPCKVCGTEIKKISLGGRGTYLCPHCQKAV